MRALAIIAFAAACEPNATPQPLPDASYAPCVPTRSGTIDEAHLPIALGATLPFYAGTNRTVDLVPTNGVYDLSMQAQSDTVVAIGPVGLGSQWYANDFPMGQFVVDAGSGLDGIYHQDATALWLDGTASQQENPPTGKTLVQYAAPLATLRFPLQDGETYSSVEQLVSTTIDGLPLQGSDEIDVDVTLGEQLAVPYVDFSPILRVRTNAIRTPSTGTPVVNKRTTLFMFECFGEVARAESNDNEPNADFTSAAYLRRYALGQSP
ncbi:MAG TPA: hypothetical protein VH143_15970 [Kofleriaceae bacterium]|jgi:hypothetical protein|nr:hypothetical protein [Kofleriaceae bacterium]